MRGIIKAKNCQTIINSLLHKKILNHIKILSLFCVLHLIYIIRYAHAHEATKRQESSKRNTQTMQPQRLNHPNANAAKLIIFLGGGG